MSTDLKGSDAVVAGQAVAEAGGDPGAVATVAERLGVPVGQLQALVDQTVTPGH